MNYDKSWGHLGKPPKSVLDGTSTKMALFKFHQAECMKASKLANPKQRAIKLAEIKAKYTRDFPPEE